MHTPGGAGGPITAHVPPPPSPVWVLPSQSPGSWAEMDSYQHHRREEISLPLLAEMERTKILKSKLMRRFVSDMDDYSVLSFREDSL